MPHVRLGFRRVGSNCEGSTKRGACNALPRGILVPKNFVTRGVEETDQTTYNGVQK